MAGSGGLFLQIPPCLPGEGACIRVCTPLTMADAIRIVTEFVAQYNRTFHPKGKPVPVEEWLTESLPLILPIIIV
jgi:hypothetical protein